MLKEQKNEYVIPAVILSLGILFASIVAACTFYKVRMFDNDLSVTGSAKTRVFSDSVKWNSTISRTVTENTLERGYAELSRDLATAKTFFASKGITEAEIKYSPVFTNEIYKYNPQGDTGPREYNLVQNITIQSGDVNKITELAKNVNELINKGVFLQNQYPEYFYSKLSELRVTLLGDAIKDAKARAEMIAEAGGRSIGALKSASSGVVQVLAPNSVEISDYGQYDTQSIEKDVMVTVRAAFVVN